MKIRHLLTDKDASARTASCSECGPVSIRPNGPGKWICVYSKRSANASWREANPEKVTVSRGTNSPHRLLAYSVDGGICPIDGEVAVVAIGRGYMCAVRAAELGHTQNRPAASCSVCGYWETANRPLAQGICGPCRDDGTSPTLRRSFDLSATDLNTIGQWFETDLSDDGLGEYVGERGDGWKTHTDDLDEFATEGWDYADYDLRTLGPPLDPDDPWLADMRQQRELAKKARQRRWAQ